MARLPLNIAGRRVVLRASWPHSWAAVRARRDPHAATEDRSGGRRPPPVRAHQLRHAHAVEMSREGIPLLVIQHADLGITSAYLRGIDNTEIIHAVHERPAPMIPAATRL